MELIAEAPVTVSLLMPLKDQTVNESESMTLTCKLSTSTREVKWYRKDKVIALKSGNKYQMMEDGSTYSLTIPSAVKADTCEYMVKCGNLESAAKVIVKGEHVFAIFALQLSLSPLEVLNDNNVRCFEDVHFFV